MRNPRRSTISPWRERTLTVAQALGEVEQAEALVADIEGQFTAAAEANPEFDGATSLVGLAGADGQAYAYGRNDTRSEVLVRFGFEVPEVITEQVPEDSFFVMLSQERVEEEGRDLFLPYDPLGGAMSFASVLSLPFLIEELVPELQLAHDGEPATTSHFGR